MGEETLLTRRFKLPGEGGFPLAREVFHWRGDLNSLAREVFHTYKEGGEQTLLARRYKHPPEEVLYLTVSAYLTVSGFTIQTPTLTIHFQAKI